MRRALLLPPVVLYTSACGLAEMTPAHDLSYAPPPPLASVEMPARSEALARWQLHPTDPWAAYAKYTLFSALAEQPGSAVLPDVMSFPDTQLASLAGKRLAQQGLPPDTLFIVDMRGAASVAFGVGLSRAATEAVSLIPTFNNWPDDNEVVPAEETLAALVTMAPRVSDADFPHPVFLLDSWRLAYRDEEPADDAYDNRYILSPADLPDAAILRSRGIRQIVYVVESLTTTTVEEDDLHATFLDYQDAGLLVAMVDLEFFADAAFEQPGGTIVWSEAIPRCILRVRPRVTIIEQPGFYARAHGGFGGVHAGPPIGVGWGGWHGGGG
jgi:hypothetical protein